MVVHTVIYSKPGVPLALFSPLTCPPDTDDDTKQAEQTEDGTQKGHQVIDGWRHDSGFHFDLCDGQQHGAVVTLGQGAHYSASHLLDMAVVRKVLGVKRNSHFYSILV